MDDHTLTDAIAEVKLALDTILNAVLSGDLIPRADAELAVAEAIRREERAISPGPAACEEGVMLTKEQIEKQLAYWRSNPGHGPTFVDFELVAETALDALAEVQRLREERDSLRQSLDACIPAVEEAAIKRGQAEAERDAALARVEKLLLQLDQKDALYDSAYQAGVKVGWNLGVSDDEAGFRAATSSTEHVAELKRIRADFARAALDEDARHG